jgi:hypothetical protein
MSLVTDCMTLSGNLADLPGDIRAAGLSLDDARRAGEGITPGIDGPGAGCADHVLFGLRQRQRRAQGGTEGCPESRHKDGLLFEKVRQALPRLIGQSRGLFLSRVG